jgi:hypothetical protein
MRVERLPMEVSPREPPPEVAAFLRDARSRVDRFLADHTGHRIPSFVSSDPLLAYDALSQIASDGTVPGATFCEWGTGIGTVACLASLLGYRATGIEIEPDLFDAARRLARDNRIEVDIVRGSYTPPGTFTGDVDMPALEAELGFAPTAFDVVYAYPWPAEEDVVLGLFERFAPAGSLLLTFHGGGDVRLHRRVG